MKVLGVGEVMSNIVQKQIGYYRARAKEYDEWFYRQGYYDRGEVLNEEWRQDAQIVRDQLLDSPKLPHILEMAGGTGIWTQELVKISDKLTVLDASPEMIEINRAKVQSDKVTYQLADLFQWQPEQQVDMVFFGFWLSHVPKEKLSPFLETVHRALKPDGRLFFIDSQKIQTGTSNRQKVDTVNDVQKRVLNDGSEFEIIKIYYNHENLTKVLNEHGFDVTVQATPKYFIYADGKKIT
jgi:ubiquinone/menaquinone biosynthesis C-methylase UbiE